MIKLRESLNIREEHGTDRAMYLRPRVDVNCQRTGEVRPTLDRTFGYVMECALRVKFWANDAQYIHARENAEKMILHHAYAEVINELDVIRSALYTHDIEAALSVVDKLQKELMGPC